MRKNFDSVQMLETSEVFDKFSKSVSYETLVGGTTTTGREYEHNQRLCECGADKPLSAVGTLTSLLCNSAKVVEKLFYRHSEPKAKNPKKTGTVMPDLLGHLSRIKKESAEFLGSRPLSCPRMTMLWILRLRLRMTMKRSPRMTIPALALLFTLATTAESWADDVIPTSGTCNADETCLWTLDSAGTLTISAKDGANDVKMANYYCLHNPCDQSTLISRPWEASLQQIKSVVIGDNITYIGKDAFKNASNLTSVTGMKDVKTIGSNGVFAYTGLTSITIPDSVTSIGGWAFYGASSLTSITIPEGVKSIGDSVFEGATGLESIIIPDNINTADWDAKVFRYFPANTNIVCQGDVEKCKKALAKFGGTGKCTVSYCINSNLIVAADESQCTSTNYYWSGTSCNNKKNGINCAKNWKQNEDFCNRIQYTPAEAAKVLRDDDKNEVTITFKK